jgi:Fe-S oxidoreductase
MCPSYQATLEERHSTRGRARMLFEMLHGGAITGNWHNEPVEQALDLCLSCKGCKSDCPTNVDMATYKSEFRAHHYRGRLRPMTHYSMGLIHWWSRLASLAPGLANRMIESASLKRLAGIAPEREMPAFAPETFRRWFKRQPAAPGGKRVILFADTFNNFFTPETAIAATRFLRHAGMTVELPSRTLCCGRPLYDIGMLPTAKRLLRLMMDTLEPEIRAGVPLVGLEPACVSAIRDELPMLFPGDPLAQRLAAQTFLLGEFVAREQLPVPQRAGKALVKIHCHHHAVLDTEAETRVLRQTGLDAEMLPSGCCGMAGAFGFEADHYAVSQRIAERSLLPHLNAVEKGTLVLADGFSCREQIRQATGRRPLHLAELLAEGLPEEDR